MVNGETLGNQLQRVFRNAARYENVLSILNHWLAGHDLNISEQTTNFWVVSSYKKELHVEFDTFEQAFHYVLNKVSKVDDEPPA